MAFSIQEKIKALDREIGYRRRVYPRLVAKDEMTAAQADYQIAVMEDIKETLLKTAPAEGLFGGKNED